MANSRGDKNQLGQGRIHVGPNPPGGGVLNFELGTDVRPEVSTTTL